MSLAGRADEAKKAMARMREIDPVLRVSNLKNLVPFRRPEDFAGLLRDYATQGSRSDQQLVIRADEVIE
jgi:hypothetical protein